LRLCSLRHQNLLFQVKIAAEVLAPAKLDELKEAKNLASDIVESGEKLFRLLGREDELKVIACAPFAAWLWLVS
jgi:hypothetical protein